MKYPLTNLEACILFLSTIINIRGCQIMLKDKNATINANGREDIDTTSVYVKIVGWLVVLGLTAF